MNVSQTASSIGTTTTNGSSNSSNGIPSSQIAGSSMNRRNNNNSGNNSSNSNSNKVKKKKFYPKLIATQIIAIQCFHYFILTLLYEINAMIFTVNTSHVSLQKIPSSISTVSTTYMSLDRIFTDQYIDLYRLSSYPDIITTFISAICTAYVFVVIVEKSKQCLDFAITLFVCHVLFVWLYSYSFPTHIEWYIIQVLSTIIMILLAEHLCVKRELDDIPLLTL